MGLKEEIKEYMDSQDRIIENMLVDFVKLKSDLIERGILL